MLLLAALPAPAGAQTGTSNPPARAAAPDAPPSASVQAGPPEVQAGGPYLGYQLEEALRREPRLSDDGLAVTLQGGVIVLSGEVDSRAELLRAQEIVRSHKPALLRIENRLSVRAASGAPAPASTAGKAAPARPPLNAREVTATAELRTRLEAVEALATLGGSRSRSPDIREVSARVRADAGLLLRTLGDLTGSPRLPRAKPLGIERDKQALAGSSRDRFNLAYLSLLKQRLTEAVTALAHVDWASRRPALADLQASARTELAVDLMLLEALHDLYARRLQAGRI